MFIKFLACHIQVLHNTGYCQSLNQLLPVWQCCNSTLLVLQYTLCWGIWLYHAEFIELKVDLADKPMSSEV